MYNVDSTRTSFGLSLLLMVLVGETLNTNTSSAEEGINHIVGKSQHMKEIMEGFRCLLT